MAGVEKSGTGITQADWLSVHHALPPQAKPVLIAYRFGDDDELTVDMGERDGDQWLYLGGGPIEHGEVVFWAQAPAAPALPLELAEAA